TGRPLDAVQLVAVDDPCGTGPHRLEDVLDGEVPVAVSAREDRPAVEEYRGQVEPGGGHEHAGQALVAAGEGDHPVQTLAVHDALDRVGDDLPGGEGGPHPLRPHGDPVGDGDGGELDGEAAGGAHALLGRLGQTIERQVAGRDLVPRRGDADLRLAP